MTSQVALWMSPCSLMLLAYFSNIILTFTATNDNGVFLPYTEYDAAKRRTVKTHVETCRALDPFGTV